MATVELKGGEKLQAYLAELAAKLGSAKTLRVGFLEGSTEADGTSIPMIAAVQNWGAPGIPARPFFTEMVEKNQDTWGALLQEGLRRNDMDAAKALAFAGQIMVEQLQDSIEDGAWTANSPVTNLLKQRFPVGGQTFDDVLKARADVKAGATAPPGKPLVQSGDMKSSAAFEVE
jgi:hypothetical protein